MEIAVTTSLPPEEIDELDRVCRRLRVSRPEAVYAAVQWYIGREGDLPPVADPTADDDI